MLNKQHNWLKILCSWEKSADQDQLTDQDPHYFHPHSECISESEVQTNKAVSENLPITTKVLCFSRLLKCLRSLYGKQCGPRSDCSYSSSLFWVHAVSFYTLFISNIRQSFAADDFSRRHFRCFFSWRFKGY